MKPTYIKPLLAFVAGVVLAGGGVYYFSQSNQPATQQVAAVMPPPASSQPQTTPEPVAPPPAPAPAAVERPAPARPKPVKAKPAVRREPVPKPVPVVEDRTANELAQNAAPSVEEPKQEAVPPPPPQPPKPKTVTLNAGTLLQIRTNESLSTDRNTSGDRFTATLDVPIVVNDMVIAERGARVQGVITQSEKAGRVKGVSEMALELTEIHTSDGQTVKIETSPWQKVGETSKKKDAAKVGIGAGVGAALGAIFGGGKGAAIGAAAGGGAGTAGVLMTRGKPVEIPSETRLTFKLQSPVTITEKLNSRKSESGRYDY